jgi:hypothetical protein
MPYSVSPARTTTVASSGMRCGGAAGAARGGVERRVVVGRAVDDDGELAGVSRFTTRDCAQPASVASSRHAKAIRTRGADAFKRRAPSPASR